VEAAGVKVVVLPVKMVVLVVEALVLVVLPMLVEHQIKLLSHLGMLVMELLVVKVDLPLELALLVVAAVLGWQAPIQTVPMGARAAMASLIQLRGLQHTMLVVAGVVMKPEQDLLPQVV
jgi:hypothetical protein